MKGMHFNYLDIILFIPLVWAIYRGWIKGLILQLATLAALVLGLWGARILTEYLVPILKTKYDITSQYTQITVYAICLIVIFVLVYFIGWLLTKFVKVVALGVPNRLAGVVFSLMKYGILMAFFVFYLDKMNNQFNFMDPTLPEGSFLYHPLLKTSHWMYEHLHF
jgi:membrane protein required for colicin V production